MHPAPVIIRDGTAYPGIRPALVIGTIPHTEVYIRIGYSVDPTMPGTKFDFRPDTGYKKRPDI